MTDSYAIKIAADFTEFLNEFHTYQQPYDDQMDADLHEQYARILREQSKWGYFDFRKGPDGVKRPHFSPSSAGKSDRELYEKVKKSPRDETPPKPWQRRWTSLGGDIGGNIQREIMLAERHFKKFTGKNPRFKFERTDRNEPCFEHFTKKMHEIEYDGERFAMFGLGDGILEYTTDDGELIRVGLEIKSKQQSYADTSERRLPSPKHDHEKQTVSYSEMYGLDYFVILYVNASKKGWFMSDEDFEKSPDIRAFGKYIPQSERDELNAKYARVVKAAREGTPPPLDIQSFRFNDYKTAIAKSLTDDEFTQLKAQVRQAQRGNLQAWQKQSLLDSFLTIQEIREGSDDAAG